MLQGERLRTLMASAMTHDFRHKQLCHVDVLCELTQFQGRNQISQCTYTYIVRKYLSMALTPCLNMQALIHSRMRKRMQNMILELGQAKTNKREVLAAINTN